jgi:hypothetical protein
LLDRGMALRRNKEFARGPFSNPAHRLAFDHPMTFR